jgi:hypothetical protein
MAWVWLPACGEVRSKLIVFSELVRRIAERPIGLVFAIRPMANGLFMLNAIATAGAATGPSSLAATGFSSQESAPNVAGTPTFSQVFSGSRAAQAAAANAPPSDTPGGAVGTAAPRAWRGDSRSSPFSNTSSGAAPHSSKDSASQSGTTANTAPAATPTAPLTVTASPASAILAAVTVLVAPATLASADAAVSTGTSPVSSESDEARPSANGIGQKSGSSASPPSDASIGTTAIAAAIAGDASPVQALGGPEDDAAGGQQAASDGVVDGAASETTSAAPATQSVAAKPSAHAQPSQQLPLSDLSIASAQSSAAPTRNLQLLANAAASSPQASFQQRLPLPDAAPLVTANSESASGLATAPRSTSNLLDASRSSLAQRIEAGLAALGASSVAVGVQAPLGVCGNASGFSQGGTWPQNNGQSFPQSSGAQSSGQPAAQASTATHAAGDARSSSTSEPAQGTSQTAESSPASAQQNSLIAQAAANASPATASANVPAHVSAQITAQMDTTANASGAARSAHDAPTPSAQPEQLPTLPRSLNDVSQASQLYQRVGGAEMHIAMDTDLLGSIDLRAVVHQGSLSATIGVQRADVQTLLVNELPALQHSLAEKNLQVGQILVTSGSVGSGTSPNSQPHDQQSRQQSSAPHAPIFRDESATTLSSAAASLAVANNLAAVASGSARLSVLA